MIALHVEVQSEIRIKCEINNTVCYYYYYTAFFLYYTTLFMCTREHVVNKIMLLRKNICL